MRKLLYFLLPVVFATTTAFCGFYVAKADGELFNKSSEVIIARSNGQTSITMASDFRGDVKDFAMVVPVPVVLKENQIRVAESYIFSKLDAYSGPRLVEYYDENPCMAYFEYDSSSPASLRIEEEMSDDAGVDTDEDFGVTIEAKYTVGEYDILILSAEESDGLEKWLSLNEYKIPSSASEILQPYIRNNMKFFVVKVNLEAFAETGESNLRPLQMSFQSEKFGLPIRLGMANAQGDQDMIVYAFSDEGRIETTNYRTVEVPSNLDIPLFVQERYGEFYVDLFDRAWKREGKDAVIMEYSWNLDGSNFTKCDPCVTTPPTYAELREAGVFWVSNTGNNWGANYQGKLHMTRLHVRYNRKTFPQDLVFQSTPNRANFQGRYVMHRPAQGDLGCDNAQAYLKQLVDRRSKELRNLEDLTGWGTSQYRWYIYEYAEQMKTGAWLNPDKDERNELPWGWIGLCMIGGSLLGWKLKRGWVQVER